MEADTTLHNNTDIIWQGKPVLRIWFAKVDIFLIPYSLLFGAITIGVEIGIIKSYIDKSDTILLFLCVLVLPFCVFAIYQIIGRYYWKYRKKSDEHYVLTNSCVEIHTKQGVQTLKLKKPLQVKLIDINRKGVGTIIIGKGLPVATYLNTGMDFLLRREDIFVLKNIPNAKMVYDTIKRNIL